MNSREKALSLLGRLVNELESNRLIDANNTLSEVKILSEDIHDVKFLSDADMLHAVFLFRMGQYENCKQLIQLILRDYPEASLNLSFQILLVCIDQRDGCYHEAEKRSTSIAGEIIKGLKGKNQPWSDEFFNFVLIRGISVCESVLHKTLSLSKLEMNDKGKLRIAIAYFHMATDMMRRDANDKHHRNYPMLLAYLGLNKTILMEQSKKEDQLKYFTDAVALISKDPLSDRHVIIHFLMACHYFYLNKFSLCNQKLLECEKMLDTLFSWSDPEYSHPLLASVFILQAKLSLRLGFGVAAERFLAEAEPHLRCFTTSSVHWSKVVKSEIEKDILKLVKPTYSNQTNTQFSRSGSLGEISKNDTVVVCDEKSSLRNSQ